MLACSPGDLKGEEVMTREYEGGRDVGGTVTEPLQALVGLSVFPLKESKSIELLGGGVGAGADFCWVLRGGGSG